jgi:hypothetical protein
MAGAGALKKLKAETFVLRLVFSVSFRLRHISGGVGRPADHLVAAADPSACPCGGS